MKKLIVTMLGLLLTFGMTLSAYAAEGKLTGTPFGLEPSWAAGSEFDKAWDGKTDTFYDYQNADGGITGIDLGEAKVITKIRFYPRDGYTDRAVGGKFQASNSADGEYVDLYTINEAPALDWVEVPVTDTNAYRYIRYAAPNGGYGNIAEIEVYGEASGGNAAAASTPKTGDEGTAIYIIAILASLGSIVIMNRKKLLVSSK